MNIDEDYTEERVTEEFICRSCGDHVSGYAAIDPIEINGDLFCDHCASNYTALQIDGYLHAIKDMTAALVAEVDKANAQKAWEQEYDKLPGRVNHI